MKPVERSKKRTQVIFFSGRRKASGTGRDCLSGKS